MASILRKKTSTCLGIKGDYQLCVCVYPSPVREGSTFNVIIGVQSFRTEMKPVGKVSVDANLKRFQHILFWDRTKQPILVQTIKGPVFKSFMRQVAIIEDNDVPRKFWIL